jgi:hypothetical protein
MKSVDCLRDLEQFGIHPLTGEADNLMFRILCDVDYRGYRTICEAFGLRQHMIQPNEEGKTDYRSWTPPGWAENWNPGPDYAPHIASIMLAPEDILSISVVGLLTVGRCHTVIITEKRQMFGFHSPEEWFQGEYDFDKGEYIKRPGYKSDPDAEPYWPSSFYGKPERCIKGSNHLHQGTRNVHQMSGRTV